MRAALSVDLILSYVFTSTADPSSISLWSGVGMVSFLILSA